MRGLSWFYVSFAILATTISQKDELISVVAVYRHGDRSPTKIYPNDPYNISYWPMGLGQLTNQGKQRCFELGQWLGRRYDGFLSKSYNYSQIKIYSTDVDRALMSAETVLAGLYPPYGDQIWNSDVRWQPIPIRIASAALLNGYKICTKFQKLHEELITTDPFFTNLDKNNKILYQYLTNMTGSEVTNFKNGATIWGTLFVENHNNLVLPDWTLDVFPEKLQPLEEAKFASLSYTEELAKLSAGPFLNNIVEHFYKFINQQDEEDELSKFLMYSAHDTSLASILGGLGAFTPHSPYYSSTIMFELYKRETEFLVKIFYKSQDDIIPIHVKGCPSVCPLQDFKFYLSNVTITEDEWVQECF